MSLRRRVPGDLVPGSLGGDLGAVVARFEHIRVRSWEPGLPYPAATDRGTGGRGRPASCHLFTHLWTHCRSTTMMRQISGVGTPSRWYLTACFRAGFQGESPSRARATKLLGRTRCRCIGLITFGNEAPPLPPPRPFPVERCQSHIPRRPPGFNPRHRPPWIPQCNVGYDPHPLPIRNGDASGSCNVAFPARERY